MIRHILKVIWNERKANAWIVLEFIIVFCVLWFCCDYLYYLGTRYFEPHGFDIDHTYTIKMGKDELVELEEGQAYTMASLFKTRVEQYPGVESVAFGVAAMPYGWNTAGSGFYMNEDSTNYTVMTMWVTPEFFDVFKIKVLKGQVFEGDGMDSQRDVLISPGRDGTVGWSGSSDDKRYSVEEVNILRQKIDDNSPYRVIGIVEKQKRSLFESYESNMLIPLTREKLNLSKNQIIIRVRPEADNGFAERFASDMKEQLSIGPYFLTSVTSLKDLQKEDTEYEVTDDLNSVIAITLFLIINIFLGIIGTFWSRIQSRRGEIGLRMAMGTSRKRIQLLLFTETFLLLFISSVVGTVICLNLGQTDLLEALGIPLAEYEEAGFGYEQNFINYGLTFLFMLLVSLFSVWYPVRQASKLQPAETLRDE